MGERKGQNFYYPPDFDPAKHRNLNAYHGTHALRERARKLDRGIIIIRFEMPYNIWCLGCGIHVAMGVRYNAEKTKVGMYYSTPIYKFRMKCHLCDNYYEIQTDPQNFEYVILSGARRKEQRWDPAENEQLVGDDRETQRKLATDAMFKLEHSVEDRAKKERAAPSLQVLEESAAMKHRDDFSVNQAARKIFRDEKKEIAAQETESQDVLQRHSLSGGELRLLGETEEDRRASRLLKYSAPISFDERQRSKISDVQNSTIFCNRAGASSSKMSSSSSSSGSSICAVNSSEKIFAQKQRQMRDVAAQLRKKRQREISFPVDTGPGSPKSIRLTSSVLGIKRRCLSTDSESFSAKVAKESSVDEAAESSGLGLLTTYSSSDSDSV